MIDIWDGYAGNLAFVGLAIAMWAHLSIWFTRQWASCARPALGLSAGATAIGSIMLAVEASPGILIDIRHAPLALAAMFGGPVAAAISATMVIGFRLWVGGAGMPDGIIAVFLVSALGLAVHGIMRKRQPLLRDVAMLAGGLAAVLVAALAALPTLAATHMLARAGFELVLLNGIATLLGGFILFMTRRTHLERSILESAFAQSPDFIYVKDRDSRFLAVNNNMATLYHAATTSALLGRSDFDVMPLALAEELYAAEQDMMRSGRPIVDAFEHIGDRFLLASKVPLRDREGRVVGLAGVTRDITERNVLETELRESKNLLARAMAGMSDGLAMFDRDGRLVFCNEQYRLAFPLSGDVRVPGAHITDILRRVAESGERAEQPEGPVEDWVTAAAATLHRNKDEEVEFSNGDWRSIRTRLADDGTAMVMVSDLTASKHAEAALRIAAQQLRNLADTDGLTGVVNRRAFDEVFAGEAARAARDGTPLSLLMIDIDWFKAYNDTYGHPAGDDCLRRVSRILAGCARRPADIVARYGGEEFVALLPGTDMAGARILGEEFSAGLREMNIEHSGSPLGRVSVSIGIATGRGIALRNTADRLIATADAALYDAKARGRNSIAERVSEPRASSRLTG